MADANDGRVTLWRGDYYEGGEFFLRPSEHQHRDEYIARPRADDDAREERIEKLRDEGFAMHAAYNEATRDRDEWKARAERAEAECAAREDVQARLIKERNAAEAERDSARALLREARGYVKTVYHQQACMGGGQTESDLLARIDAELEGA